MPTTTRRTKQAAAKWLATEQRYLQAMQERDTAIAQAVADGAKQTEVADLFNLTKMRVNQIVRGTG
jgi:hypothetical protein